MSTATQRHQHAKRLVLNGGFLPIHQRGSSFATREELLGWLAGEANARLSLADDGGLAGSVLVEMRGPIIGVSGQRFFLVHDPVAACLGGLEGIITVGGVTSQVEGLGIEFFPRRVGATPSVSLTHVRGNVPDRFDETSVGYVSTDVYRGSEHVGSRREGLSFLSEDASRCSHEGDEPVLCVHGHSWKTDAVIYKSIGSTSHAARDTAASYVVARLTEVERILTEEDRSPRIDRVALVREREVLRDCLHLVVGSSPFSELFGSPEIPEACFGGLETWLRFTLFATVDLAGRASDRTDPSGDLEPTGVGREPVALFSPELRIGVTSVGFALSKFFASLKVGDAVTPAAGAPMTAEDLISGICARHEVQRPRQTPAIVRTVAGAVAEWCVDI